MAKGLCSLGDSFILLKFEFIKLITPYAARYSL